MQLFKKEIAITTSDGTTILQIADNRINALLRNNLDTTISEQIKKILETEITDRSVKTKSLNGFVTKKMIYKIKQFH